jgi:hypothetical protein
LFNAGTATALTPKLRRPFLFMAKKQWILVLTFILLAGIYVYFFTGWFRPQMIHIFHVARPQQKARIGARVAAGSQNTAIVTFGFDSRYQLTEIKVVRLSEWQTNHLAQPLWHLISDSNSVPVKMFPYGVALRGMKPAVARTWPQPLETNVTYRLFVSAGSVKGQHDFSAPPKRSATNIFPHQGN